MMPLMSTISNKNDRPEPIVKLGDYVTIVKRINPYVYYKPLKEAKWSGTVYAIDYLPINRSIPNGEHVDYISIKFPVWIYREIITQGWIIYARLNGPNEPVKKYNVASCDYKTGEIKVLPDGCYIGTGTVLPIENIEAILIWHVAFEILREVGDFANCIMQSPPTTPCS